MSTPARGLAFLTIAEAIDACTEARHYDDITLLHQQIEALHNAVKDQRAVIERLRIYPPTPSTAA